MRAATRDRPQRGGFASRWAFRLLGWESLVFVVVTGALWFLVAREGVVSLDSAPVRGVRLGMTSESVREVFVDAAAGRWSSRPGCSGEALEWARTDARATATRWARFEFHRGLVVAIRLLADPTLPIARHVDVTPAAIVDVRPGADGSTSTTVLAVGCERHLAEVRQVLASSASP
jgi:hypothetical protein